MNSCLEPGLATCGLDPYDIKALYSPVDFIVFNGLNQKNLEEIVFLGKDKRGDAVEKSLKSSIEKGKYEWKLARVTDEGKVEYE